MIASSSPAGSRRKSGGSFGRPRAKRETGREPARRRAFTKLLPLITLAFACPATADQGVQGNPRLFGDFRLRLEQDWDSLQGDGVKRDDRLRLRFRLRGGVNIDLNDNWYAKLQARSGPKRSQQSPHITIKDFDGGPDGPYEFNLDHWYLGYTSGGFSAWAGRNILSSWHQDDFVVFDNITYAGAGGTFQHDFAGGTLGWYLNIAALPVGMRDFSGTGLFAELAYSREYTRSGFTIAAGFAGTNADSEDPAGELLLTENNTRDYREFSLQVQYRYRLMARPLKLGFEYVYNGKNYDNAPQGSFSEFHKNHVDGYVLEAQWGSTEASGDWQLSYYYAHVDALALHSSYTQDDWVRWGNAVQARATNLKGSEFRARYTIRPGMNLIGRLFFVDAVDFLRPGDISRETGNRLRIDWNISF